MALDEVQEEMIFMSFNSFRRIFRPTLEEQINDLNKIIRLHDELIGTCFTCEHYISSSAPGFVTDYGFCESQEESFLRRLLEDVNNLKVDYCPLYREQSIDNIRAKLAKLEREVIPENGRNSFEKFILTRFERKE